MAESKPFIVLKGRKLELARQAGAEAQAAEAKVKEATEAFTKARANFYAVMELSTGKENPETMMLDVSTGAVTRVGPGQQAPAPNKKPSGRRTAKA